MSSETKSFPQTYSTYSNKDLIDIYAAAPERLNEVIDDLSVKELTAHPKPEKWSIQEIAVHLSEAEIMGAARIRQTFYEPGSRFALYEQDIWATEGRYQEWDTKTFYSAIMMFDSLRLNTAKIFQKAKAQDWEKQGVHPELGVLTLRQLLEIYADHGERHIGQILELRNRMDKKIDFPLLLPERLY